MPAAASTREPEPDRRRSHLPAAYRRQLTVAKGLIAVTGAWLLADLWLFRDQPLRYPLFCLGFSCLLAGFVRQRLRNVEDRDRQSGR